MTDAKGTPLVVQTGPANERDEKRLPSLLDASPVLRGRPGRPRTKPLLVQGDAGYGFPHTIRDVIRRGIQSELKPRGSEHGSGLGRKRWVVERTLSWFNNSRRLRMCYERLDAHFQAFHDLAATLICFKRLQNIK